MSVLKRWTVAAVAMVALSVGASAARAEFDILITSGGNVVSFIQDNVQNDTNQTPGVITLSGAELAQVNADLASNGGTANLMFNSLSASTNNATGGSQANLTVGGELQGTGQIEILASANDFNFPSTGPALLGSSASQTYTFSGAGSVGRFTSYFNQSNTPMGTETPSGFLSFVPNPNAPGGVSSPVGVPSGSIPLLIPNVAFPYGLSNFTELTLTGSSATKVGFSGTTTLTAVPEPGSIALLVLGSSVLAFRKLRRTVVVA